jgi:hypothetical protein
MQPEHTHIGIHPAASVEWNSGPYTIGGGEVVKRGSSVTRHGATPAIK